MSVLKLLRRQYLYRDRVRYQSLGIIHSQGSSDVIDARWGWIAFHIYLLPVSSEFQWFVWRYLL